MSYQPESENFAVDFAALPGERLERMHRAGADVVECHRVLAKTGDNLVGEVLRDGGTFYEWNHYPEGDVYDSDSHAQFYYHAHPQELRGGEHGHFHTFMRPLGMPKGVMPAPVADFKAPDDENDALSHLVAISMDEFGVPIRLFTTNRWVTGETWYIADDVRIMLELFEIDLVHPSWPLNRWITGVIALFQPQIAALLTARDACLAEWSRTHPDANAYEDRGLELTSLIDISVDDQLAGIAAALDAG